MQCVTVCKGGGEVWDSRPQTNKYLPQSSSAGKSFRWRNFALYYLSIRAGTPHCHSPWREPLLVDIKQNNMAHSFTSHWYKYKKMFCPHTRGVCIEAAMALVRYRGHGKWTATDVCHPVPASPLPVPPRLVPPLIPCVRGWGSPFWTTGEKAYSTLSTQWCPP